MFSAPTAVAMPWAWISARFSSSAVARRWSVMVSGRPSATSRTIRMYANARTRRVRTFVAASYASSGARNRKPTPRMVVM